jgi:hypothetical protein
MLVRWRGKRARWRRSDLEARPRCCPNFIILISNLRTDLPIDEWSKRKTSCSENLILHSLAFDLGVEISEIEVLELGYSALVIVKEMAEGWILSNKGTEFSYPIINKSLEYRADFTYLLDYHPNSPCCSHLLLRVPCQDKTH